MEIKEKMKQLRKEGLSYQKIGELLGLSKQRIHQILTKYYQRPEVKEYKREYYQRPEYKDRKREYMREYYQRPEVKDRKREYKREYKKKK